jgi:hypothetical protein
MDEYNDLQIDKDPICSAICTRFAFTLNRRVKKSSYRWYDKDVSLHQSLKMFSYHDIYSPTEMNATAGRQVWSSQV